MATRAIPPADGDVPRQARGQRAGADAQPPVVAAPRGR
jgi:hypothetical protein